MLAQQRLDWIGCFFGSLSALLLLAGCKQSASSVEPQAAQVSSRIVAQGQIMPAGGILRLSATPGDVVDSISVERLGVEVDQDAELVVMRSARVREKEAAALAAQWKAAQQQKQLGIEQAENQFRIAKAKLENFEAKIDSLPRQKELLELAEQQVRAGEAVLGKLERISVDQRTREFIGGMEIDRQRIAVDEARLKFLEQREAYLQAEQDLQLARDAALLELELAESAADQARKNTGPDVAEAQLSALREQIEQSRIRAPIAGTILAIHARPGETSAQFPLIEMADLTALVCEVEVNERDAARLEVGQRAIISSHAFTESIEGFVAEIHTVVGQPLLRSPDPLAQSDYRTVTAIVRLCESGVARDWLQLQVQVEIRPSETNDCAP